MWKQIQPCTLLSILFPIDSFLYMSKLETLYLLFSGCMTLLILFQAVTVNLFLSCSVLFSFLCQAFYGYYRVSCLTTNCSNIHFILHIILHFYQRNILLMDVLLHKAKAIKPQIKSHSHW